MSKKTKICITKQEGIPREQCEEALRKMNIIRDDWTIHSERCQHDPMYRLLYFPNDLENGMAFVDHCTRNAIDIINKRYGERIQAESKIQHVFDLLRETHDVHIKVFFVLFVLHWECDPFANAFVQMYSENGGIFGSESTTHFRKFMSTKISAFVEQALNAAYNKFNIISMIDDFHRGASLEYVMGPL